MTYKTLEAALNTKAAVELSRRPVPGFEGRYMLTAKRANGKKTAMVVLYENGLYSSAVTY